MEILRHLGFCEDGRWPGTHATHVERQHLAKLSAREYMVADKTDGVRCLLAFPGNGRCFLIDRAYGATPVEVTGNREVPASTLLDGERVVARGNCKVFLAYDALRTDSDPGIAKSPLEGRLKAAAEALRDLEFRVDNARLYAHVKSMSPASDIAAYVKDYIPTLPYETDGIVLTPTNEPARPGTSSSLLKWKPASRITVDFAIADRGLSRYDLMIYDRNSLRPVAEGVWKGLDAVCADVALEKSDPNVPPVLECKMVKGHWRPVSWRKDKDRPNSMFVYHNTLKNMQEDIALQEIVDAFERSKARP